MRGTLCYGLLAVLPVVAMVAGVMMASPARAATFVYVGNAESNDIYVLQLDRQSGDLTVVEQVPIPGITKPGNSTPMAVSPDRRFLYAGTRGEPKIAAGFAIDPASGKRTYVASGPLADSMAYISTDRTGRFLLGASYPGHKITVNPIGPPGTVQPPQQVLPDYPNAHSILADAGNRYVLALTLGNDLVNQFKFDAATGMLAPNTPPSVHVKEKAGPRHFVFHPNGKLVYVIGELDGSVYVFDYDANTGQLKEKQTVSALPPDFQGKPSAADRNRSGSENFTLAIQSPHSIPCHHGNTACIPPRGVGTDPIRSASLYSGTGSACGGIGGHGAGVTRAQPRVTGAAQPNLAAFFTSPFERSATTRTSTPSSEEAPSRRSTGAPWPYAPPDPCGRS